MGQMKQTTISPVQTERTDNYDRIVCENIKRKLRKHLKGNRRLRHMTLTLKTDNVNQFQRSVKRLREGVLKLGAGYCEWWGRIELNPNEGYHAHLITITPFLSQKFWSDAWNLSSGSRIVYIKKTDPTIDRLIFYILQHSIPCVSVGFN